MIQLKFFEENIALENYIWSLENHPKFHVEIIDTTSDMNLFMNIRHSSHYPFSNLWVFVNTTNPEGKENVDTLECVLATKEGRWNGSGLEIFGIFKYHLKHKFLLLQEITLLK